MAKDQSNKYSIDRSKKDKKVFLLGFSSFQQKYNQKPQIRYSENILEKLVGNIQDYWTVSFVAALFQTALGFLVILLALLQAIHLDWLVGIVTIMGSFSILLGIYCAYYSLSKQHQAKKLIDEAIERVIEEQN
tara:strand:+ start:17 stop:415 length:399 start_codon:yes stop_codon:yes gene_type:complete